MSVLSLSGHSALLCQHLTDIFQSRPDIINSYSSNLCLVFPDGTIQVEKVVLAAMSPWIRKVLKDTMDQETELHLPDCSLVEAVHLFELLHTGKTLIQKEEALNRMQQLSRMLKLKALSVTKEETGEEIETVETPQKELRLSIEEEPATTITTKAVRKRKVPVAKNEETTFQEPASDTVRRSKRPKVQSKKLLDFVSDPKEEEEEGGCSEDSSPRRRRRTENAFLLERARKERMTSPQPFKSASSREQELKHIVSAETPLSVHEVQSESFLNSDAAARLVRHCLLCGESRRNLLGRHAFTQHMRQAHGEDKGPYECTRCRTTFPTGMKLHEHHRVSHEGAVRTSQRGGILVDVFPCPDCPVKFQNKATFAQHRRAKHGVTSSKADTTFMCDVMDCRVTPFASFVAFKAHMTAMHGLLPAKCDLCNKRFAEQQTLRNHLETHAGVLRYPCDVCQKRFVTSERLFAHRARHLGRRFPCAEPGCGFSGRTASSVRAHALMRHAEPSHECQDCHKMFGSRQNLRAHRRIHTGETPWECRLCGPLARFKRAHHLRQHLSTTSHLHKVKELQAEGMEIPEQLLPIDPKAKVTSRNPDKIEDMVIVRKMNRQGQQQEDPTVSFDSKGQALVRVHMPRHRAPTTRLLNLEDRAMTSFQHPGVYTLLSMDEEKNSKVLGVDSLLSGNVGASNAEEILLHPSTSFGDDGQSVQLIIVQPQQQEVQATDLGDLTSEVILTSTESGL